MHIPRQCKVCGKQFIAIKRTQFFCCRKCFKRQYYADTQARLQALESKNNYPIKRCCFCNVKSRLNFDPIENPEKFDAWACPHCEVPNPLIWEFQNKFNSHQIIQNILLSVQAQISFDITPKNQIYNIPITSPEIENPSMIVMTCGTLDILDIQKGNRKKILFS